MAFIDDPIVKSLACARPMAWLNSKYTCAQGALSRLDISAADVEEAEARLIRFAPFIASRFPETVKDGGIIESGLAFIPGMKARLCGDFRGSLYAKLDCDLPVAGSIKARGGIYAVLKHAETLALENGLITPQSDYTFFDTPEARAFFSRYTMQVASTGNLGLSIGIMSAALGFKVTVHMSADARQWKKDLLRAKGVSVIEYATDYSAAVVEGRKRSDADPMSYFVDDENSRDLFMGYAVAAKRTAAQLAARGVSVDADHPLFVYLPCGVGGGPGGVAFGFKLIYGDNVHIFFIEPVEAPCMALGMATGLHSKICVADIGLSGKTHADGLAVGRASSFVGHVMEGLLSGEFTLTDAALYDYMRALKASEGIFAEPSSCAAFAGPDGLFTFPEGHDYLVAHGLSDKMENSAHIAWLTGGRLVPEDVRAQYEATRL